MNTILMADAIDFYNQGNSLNSTCKKFHTTPNTLKKLFKQNNVYIRSHREQLILENKKRAKLINHDFFSNLTQENCYYLGFLAADGCVRKDRNEIKVALSSVDKQFLENMKKNMGSDNEIRTYMSGDGFEYSEFRFTSLQIKNDIGRYGIIPNKTKVGISMKEVPFEYKLAFIKGYFDGDGSLVVNNNTKQVKVSFVSHTKMILEEIQEYFNSGNIYPKDGNYSLEFSTTASLNILNSFYNLQTPCLERKYNKYLDCLKLRNNIPRDKNSSVEDEKIC